jgi:transposase
MRAFEFLTEYRTKQYRDGSKPGWYEKAVQLKRDNPRMSAIEIGSLVGSNPTSVLIWLIGKPDSRGNIYNDNPPFTEKDFPSGIKKYFDGKKPDWYEKAVQLKTDNPHMTAEEIGRQVGISGNAILVWLTGKPDSNGHIVNDNPPFTSKNFPTGTGGKKYFDGEKPWWYEQAVAMRKQGMMYKDIANKLSTPEKKVSNNSIRDWLTKGRKYHTGKIINPDAQFEPRWVQTKKIDTTEIEKLIDAGVDDADIIKYIQDEKGVKIAGQVRAMLPQLKQKLNPGTSVIDKTRTGNSKDPDITGFVKENFSD